MSVEIRRLSAGEYSMLVPTLVDIYMAAMEYDPAIREQRVRIWRGEVSWPGFTAIAAIEGGDVIGVAYGFIGSRERWWDRQLMRSMEENGGITPRRREILNSYFEVAEIHVLPGHQGRGIGAKLLTELLKLAPAEWALLSTPEIDGEANGAFGLYRKYGFEDLARNFMYPGDPRPFAILGRRLPLPSGL
ncbi:GNAT family N-acetyltransferase [Corynebacterium sp. CNCTC7651]|uniref:GNAT family N-acetyltransferase n=1 Tax=Corynebacterium sp. CNCTC7651 TaxID=2815361 RepID=UPI001F335F8C|nr:GNAT family N-acetyltransferase [Corynebacterium sp. CNCTC7651]UIZ91585.1 GNAT family N-acetyltransferase [Corynebacterium sp. CNCTC7651]